MSHSLYRKLNDRFGTPVDPMTRRRFLAVSAAAGMATMASCASRGTALPAGTKRVVVIGAGFSGLMCAHELKACGYDVYVIDARKRVGGRVVTYRDWVPGRHVEGGGELIGSNHPTWAACKERFKLEYMDVGGAEEVPVSLGGVRLSDADLKAIYEEINPAYEALNKDADGIPEDAPWTAKDAAKLDARTMSDFFADLVRGGMSVRGIQMLRASFEGDNGVAAAKQSYLGMLTQVKGGGGDKYWTESEVYRCAQGNQSLAEALAKGIGTERIKLDLPVKAIKDRGDRMLVATADNRLIECDDVVLTAAPSAWELIEFNGLMPAALRPQMGTNLKYVQPLAGDPWKDGRSPDVITDGIISESWESCDGQPAGSGKSGEPATALACFSGGPAAEKVRARTGESLHRGYREELTKLFLGLKANLPTTGNEPRYMDWPGDQWTRGGYSFPAPGQVTTVGPMMEKAYGGLHIGGEHACYKFVGYMEGALSSGAAVALRIAKRDGRAM